MKYIIINKYDNDRVVSCHRKLKRARAKIAQMYRRWAKRADYNSIFPYDLLREDKLVYSQEFWTPYDGVKAPEGY